MRAFLTLLNRTDVVCACGYRQIGGGPVATRRGGLRRFRLRQPEHDQTRGRYRRNPWSASLLARPIRSQPAERCLACRAEAAGTRGALPRLRGRYRRNPLSTALRTRLSRYSG